MSDIINLLPDAVANQIAAGEVVQRPASVVKELMENAVDAGASHIKLIVKDAGRTLIQVIDNGCGMSETDARMCFERHATSKIKKAEDLFQILTKGFRGEAMASIAAVAQVELKTKLHDRDLGTIISIEGSEIKKAENISCSAGSSVAVKNLFFNVPARRNFLKNDAIERKHIVEEFQRIALVHPDIAFQLVSNDAEIYNLPPSSFKGRIAGLFGKTYDAKLLPIEENTSIVNVSGLIVTPENSKKTRGEQYFFVNKRFIKSPYLHHAVQSAYRDFLKTESFPGYFIMMDIAPEKIDINIHPTKTEIKFTDEKSIYAILLSAVKKSLGKFHLSPSLDFEQETAFEYVKLEDRNKIKPPVIQVNPNFNPFELEKKSVQKSNSTFKANEDFDIERKTDNQRNWAKLFEAPSERTSKDFHYDIAEKEENNIQQIFQSSINEKVEESSKVKFQLNNAFIVTSIKSGLVIIHQQRAHERILFEKYLLAMQSEKISTQQLLFPQTVSFSPDDFSLMEGILPLLINTGFDINVFGKNSFVINGLPVGNSENEVQDLMEGILDNYKFSENIGKFENAEKLAFSMAKKMALKKGKKLIEEEITSLIDQLFACKLPNISPEGKKIMTKLSLEELEEKFQN
jgi:DNA mismatch repair protein MutL